MTNIIRIGTYNTNNLFDRFDDPYNVRDDPWRAHLEGTRPKKLTELFALGARIRSSNVHVLGLQEIESYGALRDFVQAQVGPEYKVTDGVVSVQGNDPRGIDLGLLSRFPLGRIISHRFQKIDNRRVFSRDCLEIEVLKEDRSGVLLTAFLCHLKSKYSRFERGTAAWVADQKKSDAKRAAQVAATIEIVKASQNVETDRFVVMGDMNDTPGAASLQAFLRPDNPLRLTDVLRTIDQDDDAAESIKKRPRDTHKWSRDDDTGKRLTTYSQLDYLLFSAALTHQFTGKAKVEHRKYTTGSDHYLAWAEVDLDA